jgi:hypothetical protein
VPSQDAAVWPLGTWPTVRNVPNQLSATAGQQLGHTVNSSRPEVVERVVELEANRGPGGNLNGGSSSRVNVADEVRVRGGRDGAVVHRLPDSGGRRSRTSNESCPYICGDGSV